MSDKALIRIVIAEDMEPIREHFKAILNYEKDIRVLDAVENGRQAVESVERNLPDILLVDIQMESARDGIDAIRTITSSGYATKCVILTIHKEDELIFEAFEAGAVDYILKDASSVDIINAVRKAYNNEVSLHPEIASKLRNEFARMKREQNSLIYTLNILYNLTQTELEILKLSLKGYKQSDIARMRFVEPTTIRTHISNIIKKFEKRNMKEVVMVIKQLKIMELFDK